MKNELFVTAGEVAQELGVSKPFAYKLVRQMNEEIDYIYPRPTAIVFFCIALVAPYINHFLLYKICQ